MSMEYIRCTRCVMDNKSDKNIKFDEKGHCNYCNKAFSQINTTVYFPNNDGAKKLSEMLELIKQKNKRNKYD